MVEAKDKSIVDKMSLQIKDYIEGKVKKIIMKKVIAANWKNNGSKKFIKDYFDYFLKNVDSNNEIIIFPPDLYISQVNDYRDKKILCLVVKI